MRRVPILILLLFALPACDGVNLQFGGLDTAALEGEILADVHTQFPTVEFEAVTCPDNVEPRVGDVFVCRVLAVDGSVGIAEVTQRDATEEECPADAEGDLCVTWEYTDVLAPGES